MGNKYRREREEKMVNFYDTSYLCNRQQSPITIQQNCSNGQILLPFSNANLTQSPEGYYQQGYNDENQVQNNPQQADTTNVLLAIIMSFISKMTGNNPQNQQIQPGTASAQNTLPTTTQPTESKTEETNNVKGSGKDNAVVAEKSKGFDEYAAKLKSKYGIDLRKAIQEARELASLFEKGKISAEEFDTKSNALYDQFRYEDRTEEKGHKTYESGPKEGVEKALDMISDILGRISKGKQKELDNYLSKKIDQLEKDNEAKGLHKVPNSPEVEAENAKNAADFLKEMEAKDKSRTHYK